MIEETKTSKEIGALIALLRKERHLRQTDLASNLGIPPSQLCKIEKGTSMPSIATLIRIAEELNVPTISLLIPTNGSGGEMRYEVDDYVAEVRDVVASYEVTPRFDAVYTTEKYDGTLPKKLLENFQNRITQYAKLEEECGIPKCSTIPFELPFTVRDSDAEALAHRVRTLCGIGSAIVFDYIQLFENHGLHIFFEKLPPEMESVSFWDRDNRNAIIFIDAKLNAERQLFRLIYEIGITYLFVRGGCRPTLDTHANTHFAKVFAASFLMPRETVLTTTAQLGLAPTMWSYELILRIKLRFSVSAEAFTVRLIELGALENNLGQDILNIIRAGYKKSNYREPGETLRPFSQNARIDDLNIVKALKGLV